MSPDVQEIQNQEIATLPQKAAELKAAGWRLVQVCATPLTGSFDVVYSFDQAYRLLNLRVSVPRGAAVLPSLTKSYLAAFTYENELQDLFGIKVENLAIDFGGQFYRKATPTPFAHAKGDGKGA